MTGLVPKGMLLIRPALSVEEVIDDRAFLFFAPGHVDGASRGCSGQWDCPDRRRCGVRGTEWCDGNPEPCPDQVHNTGPMRSLLNDIGMLSRLRDRTEIEPVGKCAGGLRVENEGFVAYVPTRERLGVSQGVSQGKNHPERFGGDGFGNHSGRRVWIPDQCRIDLPLGKASHQLRGVSLVEPHAGIRVIVAVLLYLISKPQRER